MLIAQLKSQIFEYEQNEKNFNNLHSKFRALQNDFDLVSEEKLRLEYELKQRVESSSKQIAELRGEKEASQNNLNEKLTLNKKLFNDNNNLFRTLENRNAEIEALSSQLVDCEEANVKLNEDKIVLEKNVNNLTDIKQSNELTIGKLQTEIERLSKILDQQDHVIKNQNEEKNNLLCKNDELNFELKNTLGKLKSREESLNFQTRQNEEANKKIAKLEDHVVEFEQVISRTKLELNNSMNAHAKEKSGRIESEKNCERLESILKEKSAEIKRLALELDSSRLSNDKLTTERARLLGEIERYKNYIIVLTDQNQKVFLFFILF